MLLFVSRKRQVPAENHDFRKNHQPPQASVRCPLTSIFIPTIWIGLLNQLSSFGNDPISSVTDARRPQPITVPGPIALLPLPVRQCDARSSVDRTPVIAIVKAWTTQRSDEKRGSEHVASTKD